MSKQGNQPIWALGHDLMNSLSVIIGNCDLLEKNASVDSECHKRLRAIRGAASKMVEALRAQQSDFDTLVRAGSLPPGGGGA